MGGHSVIGVTGNIACGKSTVDAMLLQLGAGMVIDADRVVHALLREDAAIQQVVVDRFGPTVRGDAGIDRRALGKIVFADPEALRDLEAILHPAVRQRIAATIAGLPQGGSAVIDAVKLVQGPLGALCASRWWVTATPDQQLDRLITTRGLSRAEALQRIAAGPRLDQWRAAVDVVIDNSGPLTSTREQVRQAWLAVQTRPSG